MTDDLSIAEWAGLTVVVVAGAPDNRKLTTAADLSDAEWRLSAETMLATGDIRVGQGFDVHGFEPGRRRHAGASAFPTSSASPVIPMPMRCSMP